MAAETQPPWINAELLEDILRMETGDADVSVTQYRVTSALPKGGGYLSSLHRVTLEFTRNNEDPTRLSLIMKSEPTDYYQLEFSNNVKAFIKEATMYRQILPAMYRLARDKTPAKSFKSFAPKCFRCPKQDVLVLEDLNESGFSLVDRRKRLDFDHALVVLRSLADFHAISLALYNEDPKFVETFAEGHYTEAMCSSTTAFFNQTFDALISNVEKWEGFERFVTKLEKLLNNASHVMMEQIKPKEGGISVLNHGDVWGNNLMFRNSPDNGKVEEVRFFDFQFARFTSPAIELHFFFYLSVQEEIMFHRYDELLEGYHSALSSRMKDYGCDTNSITLNKLKQELKDTEQFAVITACSKLWFVLVNPEDVDDIVIPNVFTRGKGTFNSFTKVYGDSVIRKVFENLLPYFESKGLL